MPSDTLMVKISFTSIHSLSIKSSDATITTYISKLDTSICCVSTQLLTACSVQIMK